MGERFTGRCQPEMGQLRECINHVLQQPDGMKTRCLHTAANAGHIHAGVVQGKQNSTALVQVVWAGSKGVDRKPIHAASIGIAIDKRMHALALCLQRRCPCAARIARAIHHPVRVLQGTLHPAAVSGLGEDFGEVAGVHGASLR